ncbi:hypothetical protein CDD81_7343 [Ophiocordyceps australis]|uniref:Vacuolar segregation protein 7 n=1 Tax=Ophiocordyceps australis TaxID=1399860 RepID=A0A2C5Y3F9_9HYPO|nr:hypothetical protein CDD81_7343 [Ophiocordyceps australis]
MAPGTPANDSPVASRDTSPTRKPSRKCSIPALATRNAASRSRKNSQQDGSPRRSADFAPAKTLSPSTTPSLLPVAKEAQALVQAPTPQKPPAVQELKDSPRWPVSPRLRSPPPQLQLHKPSIATPRRCEQEPPVISLQRPSPSPRPPCDPSPSQSPPETDIDDLPMLPGIRTPARSPLETVQEVSQNNSPARPADKGLVEHVKEKLAPTDTQSDSAVSDSGRLHKPTVAAMASSDAVASQPESRRTSSVPPPPPLISRQSSALSAKHVKPSKPEGSTQNMTVETETVPSVPQVALTAGTKSDSGNGTLKAKPSTETIKPRKDKKRMARKQPQVNPGTGSKADIFEAKIANAVDEANTSDSEETFVYDSNPPENAERANRRFHSRTPSATSMVSQADRQNLRSIYGIMEAGVHAHPHGPVPKKSMKFVNTFNGNASDSLTPGDEDGKGTGRSAGGSGRGTARHHHHIGGRWGRQPGNGHASLFDNESPFPNAAKSKLAASASRTSSGPPSPRNFHSTRGHFGTKRSAMQMSSYDLDEAAGADDERTPLIDSNRSLRNNRVRRGPHNLRQAESQTYTRRSSYLNRFAACLVLTMMLLLVITGAIGFMFATSQPMDGMEIVSIDNVVTSEQVLMFDLQVKAHNPNIVVVTVSDANLEIFAKSEYAGKDSEWWRHPNSGGFHAQDDPWDDPPWIPGDDDDDDRRPNVLLGRVTEFDSPLTFEGSLLHQGFSYSTGEMQLAYPGNDTSGGSKRWEAIYQNEFDLIIKGVVKYSLPLSAHVRSATVSGRTTVKPNAANDPSLTPNTTAQN